MNTYNPYLYCKECCLRFKCIAEKKCLCKPENYKKKH